MSAVPIIPFNQQPEPEVEKITPAKAAKLLAMNVGNRNVRKAVVQRYTDDMINGRWHFNGAPILVGQDGTLYDGQHRLMAIVESGRPRTMVIIYGVSKEAKYTIDSGTARKPGDILAFAGVADPNAIAAVARIVMAFERGVASLGGGFRPSNAEIQEWVENNPAVLDAAPVYRRGNHQVAIPPSVFAACWFVCHKLDAGAAEKFFISQLIETEGLRAGDPAKALRKRLADITGRDSNAIKFEKARYVFMAWNLFRAGKSVTKLQAPRGGWTRKNFPEPR